MLSYSVIVSAKTAHESLVIDLSGRLLSDFRKTALLAQRLTFKTVHKLLNAFELFARDLAVCMDKRVLHRESRELPFWSRFCLTHRAFLQLQFRLPVVKPLRSGEGVGCLG